MNFFAFYVLNLATESGDDDLLLACPSVGRIPLPVLPPPLVHVPRRPPLWHSPPLRALLPLLNSLWPLILWPTHCRALRSIRRSRSERTLLQLVMSIQEPLQHFLPYAQ